MLYHVLFVEDRGPGGRFAFITNGSSDPNGLRVYEVPENELSGTFLDICLN